MNRIIILYTTLPTLEAAERLADAVIEQSYAACVNIFPVIRSVYRWEGGIEHTDEYPVWFKTSETSLEALKAFLMEHHPYEAPALVHWEAQANELFYGYVVNQTRLN